MVAGCPSNESSAVWRARVNGEANTLPAVTNLSSKYLKEYDESSILCTSA